MKTYSVGTNGHWVKKIVIAASIALLPLAAAPAVGYAQYIEVDPELAAALSEKHAEVDAYLFVDHADELKEKGINVSHTGPIGSYIEIGISDYTEVKAQYLYEAFGTDLVKVVDAQQPVTMMIAAESEMATTSIDVDVPDDAEMAVTSIDGDVREGADAATDQAATSGSEARATTVAAKADVATASSNTPWIIAIAAMVLGVAVILTRKLRSVQK